MRDRIEVNLTNPTAAQLASQPIQYEQASHCCRRYVMKFLVRVLEAMHPRSKAVPIRLNVPLASLAPGRYDVQVTAIQPTDRKVAFWQAPIAVIP